MRSYPFAMVFVVARVIFAIPAVERLGLMGLVLVTWGAIAVAAFLPSFLIAWRAALAGRPVSRNPGADRLLGSTANGPSASIVAFGAPKRCSCACART